LTEGDLRRRREHAYLTRSATSDRDHCIVLTRKGLCKLLLYITNACRVGDFGAGVLEHMIDVQAEAVGGRRNARIDDVQSELIEQSRGARKAALLLRRVGRDARSAAP